MSAEYVDREVDTRLCMFDTPSRVVLLTLPRDSIACQ